MNVRRMSVLLFVGAFVGCASEASGPTQSLIRARNLQQASAKSNAGQLAAAEVHQADELLAGAEKEHQNNPRSNMEYHLANLAAFNYEIAMAEARRRSAEDQLAVLIRDREKPDLDLGEAGTVQKTEEGTLITVTGAVLFRTGESELLPIARDHLVKVAEELEQGSDKIVVVGHADSTGSDEFNDRLSHERAESVKAFLVAHGIPSERINAVGRGEKDPIATNKTPEGRANNRRVELEVPDEA